MQMKAQMQKFALFKQQMQLQMQILERRPFRDRLKQMPKRYCNFCRYGCNVVESPEHVLLHCRHVKKARGVLHRICEKRGLEFSIKTLLCDSHLQIGVEKLMADFLKSSPDTIT